MNSEGCRTCRHENRSGRPFDKRAWATNGFHVQRDVRIGYDFSRFAGHVNGCLGVLRDWKPWALRSLATFAFR